MSVQFQDYYKTLEVERSATAAEITKSYRKLARKYHPDVNKTKQAEDQFKQLSEAYEVLKDPEKRKQYDALGANWKAGQGFQPPPNWDEFMSQFGGAKRQGSNGSRSKKGRTNRGESHSQSAADFEGGNFSDFFQMFFGSGGAGQDIFSGFTSATAEQQAERARTRSNYNRSGYSQQPFNEPVIGEPVHASLTISLEDSYHGSKKAVAIELLEYDERGQPQKRVKQYQVTIPAGITNGKTIRLAGQGQPSPLGRKAGDLLLTVYIAPHPRFSIEGDEIVSRVPIAPWEAALGGKIVVRTLDGDVNITVPPGVQTGSRLRLRGKGLPRKGETKGDMLIELKVEMPKTLTEEERSLFEQLKNVSRFNPRES